MPLSCRPYSHDRTFPVGGFHKLSLVLHRCVDHARKSSVDLVVVAERVLCRLRFVRRQPAWPDGIPAFMVSRCICLCFCRPERLEHRSPLMFFWTSAIAACPVQEGFIPVSERLLRCRGCAYVLVGCRHPRRTPSAQLAIYGES